MDECKKCDNAFSEAVTAFNYKLLNAITDANGEEVKNVFISPGRLQAILVLLSNWADTDMLHQILEAICCKEMALEDANNMVADDHYLIPNASKEDQEEGYIPTVDLKTLMWYKKGENLNKHGLIAIEKLFKVLFNELDFDSPSAVDKINYEVENASHGLIKNLQIELPSDIKALLVDVLYFKATWFNRFYEEDTRTRNFYYKGGSSKVKMMSLTSIFRYFENDTFQSICLDYNSWGSFRSYSMWIHLPKKRNKVKDILAQIKKNNIGLKYETQEVHLSMPRFELESRTSLTEVLKVLGMNETFASDDAIPKLLSDVRIDDIVQQGKIEVNEVGTEATMATYIMMCGCCPLDDKPKPIEMKVNHEFIFEIVETNTGIRLFSGIVNKL